MVKRAVILKCKREALEPGGHMIRVSQLGRQRPQIFQMLTTPVAWDIISQCLKTMRTKDERFTEPDYL